MGELELSVAGSPDQAFAGASHDRPPTPQPDPAVPAQDDLTGKPLHVIVVVHGMGDQTKYAAAQAVVRQLCREYHVPQGHSIGALHSQLQPSKQDLEAGVVPGAHGWADLAGLEDYGIAEVFWADIGRSHEKYVLEDTVAWAESIVGRLEMVEQNAQDAWHLRGQDVAGKPIDLPLVRRVLTDLGLGIHLSRLANKLLTKLGQGSLPLDAALVRFLGDVQLYAEYARPRDSVMKRFHAQLKGVEEKAQRIEAEQKRPVHLHFCSHSWGSAVAFVGILQGRIRRCDWIRRTKSLMTFGSPIDKLLILWPEFADRLVESQPPSDERLRPGINWFNYADKGDPVGYRLETAREFVAAAVPGLFDVERAGKQDRVFRRYVVPGKAHVDYWDDDALFSEWFASGLHDKPVAAKPPGTKWLAALASNVLLHAVPMLLVGLAAYFAVQALDKLFDQELGWGTILAGSALLAGLILIGRSYRTSRGAFWPILFGLLLTGVGFLGLRALHDHLAVIVCATYATALALLSIVLDLYSVGTSVRGRVTAWILLAVPALGGYAGACAYLGRTMTLAGVLQIALGLLFFALAVLFWDLVSVWRNYVSSGSHLAYLRKHFGLSKDARTARAPTPPLAEDERGGARPSAAPSAAVAPLHTPWWVR